MQSPAGPNVPAGWVLSQWGPARTAGVCRIGDTGRSDISERVDELLAEGFGR